MKRLLPKNKKIITVRAQVKSGPYLEVSLPALNHFPKVVKPEEQRGKED